MEIGSLVASTTKLQQIQVVFSFTLPPSSLDSSSKCANLRLLRLLRLSPNLSTTPAPSLELGDAALGDAAPGRLPARRGAAPETKVRVEGGAFFN